MESYLLENTAPITQLHKQCATLTVQLTDSSILSMGLCFLYGRQAMLLRARQIEIQTHIDVGLVGDIAGENLGVHGSKLKLERFGKHFLKEMNMQ